MAEKMEIILFVQSDTSASVTWLSTSDRNVSCVSCAFYASCRSYGVSVYAKSAGVCGCCEILEILRPDDNRPTWNDSNSRQWPAL